MATDLQLLQFLRGNFLARVDQFWTDLIGIVPVLCPWYIQTRNYLLLDKLSVPTHWVLPNDSVPGKLLVADVGVDLYLAYSSLLLTT